MAKHRTFYFCAVATDGLNRRFGTSFSAGAATGKVLGLCAALRSTGEMPVVVSALIPWRSRDGGCTRHMRTEGIGYAKIFSLGQGVLRRLIAGGAYLLYAIRYIRCGDTVILYNYFPDYIPAAVFLRLMGRPAILDIEDAPNPAQIGLWQYVNAACFRVMLRLCANRYLTASHLIGDKSHLKCFLPVYGVADAFQGAGSDQLRFQGARIRVLFGGGSIRPETGSDLFLAAVRELARSYSDAPIDFLITGQFPTLQIAQLERDVKACSSIRIFPNANLSRTAYYKMVQAADAGLCLKHANTTLGQTTFPSKVIEFAAVGLLVCSTRVSDVPRIFDTESAVLLDTESPMELALALVDMAADRQRAAARARAGQHVVMSRFSKNKVGPMVSDFIYDRGDASREIPRAGTSACTYPPDDTTP